VQPPNSGVQNGSLTEDVFGAGTPGGGGFEDEKRRVKRRYGQARKGSTVDA
jgi:N-methylhydantoinase B/oxoprolinase/acetone carboxylase alpha subunit